MDVIDHNKRAWNSLVDAGDPWTIPVSAEQIARARQGDWQIVLTPLRPVPKSWFPALGGARVLCLAGAGGQQGPLLAAAGAHVTVFDNSPRQLEQDRLVAEREGLSIDTLEGDMRDLTALGDADFDLIVHPCSNCFVPEVAPVWREAYRVLRPGGALLSGLINPAAFIFDDELIEEGRLVVRHALPYSDTESLSPEELARLEAKNEPVMFSHTLEGLVGGQMEAGFLLAALYEDAWPDRIISKYMPTFIATRAVKPPLPPTRRLT